MIGLKTTTALALIALASGPLRAEDRMRAGLWEVTTSLDGKPAGSRNTCFTPAMVALGNGPESSLREATAKSVAKGGCVLKDFKLTGNSISTTQVCADRTTTIVSNYSKDAFETGITNTEAGASKQIRMKGRRIGDCK